MIGVTIGSGEKYRKAAEHAAASVRKHTGLETVILGDNDDLGLADCCSLKLRIFDLVDADDIFYFDADTRMYEDWDVSRFAGAEPFVAVRARWWRKDIRQRCDQWGIPRGEYFNAGMFVANRKHHKRVFDRARELPMDSKPHYDQTPLNAARAQLCPVHFLPRTYNWVRPDDGPAVWQLPTTLVHFIGGNRFGENPRPREAEYEQDEDLWHACLRGEDGKADDPEAPYRWVGLRARDRCGVMLRLSPGHIIEEIEL